MRTQTLVSASSVPAIRLLPRLRVVAGANKADISFIGVGRALRCCISETLDTGIASAIKVGFDCPDGDGDVVESLLACC